MTRSTLLAAIGLSIVGFAAPAAADTVKDCDAAYRQTQVSRRAGKLLDARAQALVCGATACPDADKTDCVQWLGEIEASLPTVVFAVRDASGADTLEVRVSVDGVVLGEQLDGKAVAIDPGSHKLRFEIAGAEPIEQNLVILEGQRNRPVEVSFKKQAPAPAQPAPKPAQPAKAPPPPSPSGRVPTWAWVTGGLGIAALAVGAGFGINALVASGTCRSQGCPGTADSVNQQRHLGLGMFLGLGTVGVAGVVAGAVGIATKKKAPPLPAALRVLPMVGPGAAGGAFAGAF